MSYNKENLNPAAVERHYKMDNFSDEDDVPDE